MTCATMQKETCSQTGEKLVIKYGLWIFNFYLWRFIETTEEKKTNQDKVFPCHLTSSLKSPSLGLCTASKRALYIGHAVAIVSIKHERAVWHITIAYTASSCQAVVFNNEVETKQWQRKAPAAAWLVQQSQSHTHHARRDFRNRRKSWSLHMTFEYLTITCESAMKPWKI